MGVLAAGAQAPQADEFKTRVRPFFNRYCLTCHHAGMKTAGVALDAVKDPSVFGENPDLYERVFRKVRTAEMPPPNAPKPAQADREFVAGYLERALDRAGAEHPDAGRVGIHRLNRAEYDNALRDLLDIDFKPSADFPADDAGYGFDNIADVLSLPPVLLEKYLKAADAASRMAVGNRKLDPVLQRISNRGATAKHRFPADAEYLIRVRLRGDLAKGLAPLLDVRVDGERVNFVEARISEQEEDEERRRFEVTVPVKGGTREVKASLLEPAAVEEQPDVARDAQGKVRARRLSVDWIEIGGPFKVTGPGDTASRRKIFSCSPKAAGEEDACAGQILGRLARQAYRRPVTAQDTAALMRFYRMGRSGGTFDDGVQLALKAMLVSPQFLFRVERESGWMVSSIDLASRLSFFLWSSIPDGELLGLAEQGKLGQPEVLRAQVKRMLADPRSKALTQNFAGQWLHLRNLAMMRPDPEKFPEYDSILRDAFRMETEMFFESVVREDRSVLSFLDADYTFLNERLAKHYGIAGVTGPEFRRVSLQGAQRGGVLTQGSVLTVSSYPTRTSPVIRGKWVLENLLGAPPPPPPPDVPELVEKGIGQTVSLRQQLEQHRASPACASCHARMDPLGFALENYDAVGKWRAQDGKFPIDSTGMLPTGEKFNNAAELRKILLNNSGEFVLALSSKLLTYALGRGLESRDQPVVRNISRSVASRDYRFSALIEAIVESPPFKMRRTVEGVKRAAD